jgi:hypothetical protein
MKYLVYGHTASTALLQAMWRAVYRRVASLIAPNRERPHRAINHRRWTRWIPLVVLCLSLAVQALLIVLVGELVDLSISLMELWAELARKHLELTL